MNENAQLRLVREHVDELVRSRHGRRPNRRLQRRSRSRNLKPTTE